MCVRARVCVLSGGGKKVGGQTRTCMHTDKRTRPILPHHTLEEARTRAHTFTRGNCRLHADVQTGVRARALTPIMQKHRMTDLPPLPTVVTHTHACAVMSCALCCSSFQVHPLLKPQIRLSSLSLSLSLCICLSTSQDLIIQNTISPCFHITRASKEHKLAALSCLCGIQLFPGV